MADPSNNESQELNLNQLKNAAGGGGKSDENSARNLARDFDNRTFEFWKALGKKLASENSVDRKASNPDQEANNPCVNDNKVEK